MWSPFLVSSLDSLDLDPREAEDTKTKSYYARFNLVSKVTMRRRYLLTTMNSVLTDIQQTFGKLSRT